MLVAVRHILAGSALDVHEVKVGAIGNPHQFFATIGVIKLNIHRALTVMCAVGSGDFVIVDALLGQPNHFFQEAMLFGEQLLKDSLPSIGMDKILNLHLGTLAVTQNEVARRNLIAEGLTLLSNPERQVGINRIHHVLEVGENPLGGLGTKVSDGSIVADGTDVGLEHHIKLTDFAPVGLATGGALDPKLLELFGGDALGDVGAKFVSTEAAVAALALYQRIGKGSDVAGGFPGAGVHQNGSVHAIHIVALLHPELPPGGGNFVFQHHAERPKIPGPGHPTIDFRPREDKSAALAKAYNIFQFTHNNLL